MDEAWRSLFLARARILIIIPPPSFLHSPLIVSAASLSLVRMMIHKGNFAIFWYAKEFRGEG